MEGKRVLLIEDDDVLRTAVADWLEQDGYRVCVAATGSEGVARARAGVDVVVLDYSLPDTNGFEVLRRLQGELPSVPVIMLTGHAAVPHVVEAMRLGAFHYLPKPADLGDISRMVRQASAASTARARIASGANPTDASTHGILGETPAIARVHALIARLASSSTATVLITGESGTGKDLAARALHAESARASRPFTNVTCTALPSNLLESELFGHERGAFTDAKARHLGLIERTAGGTIFLDEIGDMDLALQAKLLHVLEHKRFRRVGGTEDLVADVRVVAATNVDLPAAVAAGRFRADLYYRLAVLELRMPALRERRDDIGLLARSFVERFSAEAGGPSRRLDDAAIAKLEAYDWPGNVRELKNVLERAVILATGATIGADDIQLAASAPPSSSPFTLPAEGVDLRAMEKDLLVQALERTGGNVTRAAKLLGMNRDQVRYRVQKFSLRDVVDDEADP